jgi:hypothetical protein
MYVYRFVKIHGNPDTAAVVVDAVREDPVKAAI